ncbi:phosphate-starvation-inducible PsiE family protein [Methylomonas methanica]|uniref:BLUF domain protein n=1 Tax=Methylomonas methanica (strain DSM 25384 / MC09) TaxID=857087 RepID=G0A1P9_METMM|nr:phosphate-starvation-inducible PsiE family protein [Methylomonas methanica]AEG00110.1 BLUF domain protein [Methylomonas methanica MC09]
MIRLVYMSHAVKPFSTDDLMSLLRQCRHSNSISGITGVLLYFNECFVQVLEGKEEEVNKAFLKLKRDPRHKNITELERKYISERQFPDWSMGFEELDMAQLSGLNIEGLNDFFSEGGGSAHGELNQRLLGTLMTHFKSAYQKRKSHEELPVDDEQGDILKLFHKAIRFAVTVLAGLMVMVIFLGVFQVIFVLYQKLATPPYLVFSVTDLLSTFSAFLMVLIAIEIYLNISLYLRSDVIPVKLVVATALMAIARKVIVFDFKYLEPSYVYASAAVVFALGVTYWLLDKKEKHN